MCMSIIAWFCFLLSSMSEQLALIFQGIWINLMLLYVGLSIVSITINLCAQSLMTQLKKTGLYLKILQLFTTSQGDSAESSNAHAQEGETANKNDCRSRRRSQGGKRERIAMSDLEARSDGDKPNADIEDDEHHSARLKIVRDADGKGYGTLQEWNIETFEDLWMQRTTQPRSQGLSSRFWQEEERP